MERPVKTPSRAEAKETEAKTPIGFLDLPFELRLMIYRLSLPTKKIFDMMEKPIFYGRSYWDTFFATLDEDSSASEDGDSDEQVEDDEDEDSNIDDDEADHNESESDSDEEEESAEDEKDEDDSLSTDDWAEETRPNLDRLTTIRSLLLASRQIRDEALDVLYGENLLCVNVSKASRHSEPLKRLIDEGKSGRIRHIMLVLTHEIPSYGSDEERVIGCFCFAMDPEIWNPLLSNLKTLRIVVDQARLALRRDLDDHVETCPERRFIELWHETIESITSYVGKTIPAELVDGLRTAAGRPFFT